MLKVCCNRGSFPTLRTSYRCGNGAEILALVFLKINFYWELCCRGWKVASVHGGIFEPDRNKAVFSFQNGSSSVLVSAIAYF